jgi:ATP-dependent DNA helicase RecG
MSATPIPRTVMLTIFGDLDISAITELPAGRKNIITKIVAPENRGKAYSFIRQQIQRGRQTFVICPRIEPPEKNGEENSSFHGKNRELWEVKTVKEEYEKLAKRVFPDLRLAMLHGKMRADEKERVMRKFAGGEIDILISTSVVEVGVDIPNAAIMMIEGAERFGLAQLYQFRGRVGRGAHQSFCFLFTDSPYKATRERLEAVVNAKNGFELAEMDLKNRGPGEFLGNKQTGLPDIAMQGLQDVSLIQASRESARGFLSGDPRLLKHPDLKKRLEAFRARIHEE